MSVPDQSTPVWKRPEKAGWMDDETYEQMPATLTLRQVRVQVDQPDFRTESWVLVTTGKWQIVGWARADHRHGRPHRAGSHHHRRAGTAPSAAAAHRNTASMPRAPHPTNAAAIRVAMRLRCPW